MGSSRKLVTTVRANLMPQMNGMMGDPAIRLHALRTFIRECEEAGFADSQQCVVDEWCLTATLETDA